MLVKFLTQTVIKLVKNPEFTNVIKKIIEPNFFKYLTNWINCTSWNNRLYTLLIIII